MSTIKRIRFWLIRKLVGNWSVMANMHIEHGTIQLKDNVQTFMWDSLVEGPADGVIFKVNMAHLDPPDVKKDS